MKSEMIALLAEQFPGLDKEEFEWESEVAIYWFCHDWYDGQADPLYSILCSSPYTPSFLSRCVMDDSDDLPYVEDMYGALMENFLPKRLKG